MHIFLSRPGMVVVSARLGIFGDRILLGRGGGSEFGIAVISGLKGVLNTESVLGQKLVESNWIQTVVKRTKRSICSTI